jgi:hypothetical protein
VDKTNLINRATRPGAAGIPDSVELIAAACSNVDVRIVKLWPAVAVRGAVPFSRPVATDSPVHAAAMAAGIDVTTAADRPPRGAPG